MTIPLATFIMLLCTMLGAAHSRQSPPSSNESSVTRAGAERMRSLRVLPGHTRAGRSVILSAPFDGVLKELLAEESQLVEEGSVLARMDDRVAAASVAAARTESLAHGKIDHAQLEMELAQWTLDGIAASHNASAATSKEFEEARIRRGQAEAMLRQANEARAAAEARLVLETARLESHLLRAPFTGRVVRVSVEEGETITASSEVFMLVALDTLRAELNLPAEIYNGMSINDSYELRAETPASCTLIAKLTSYEPIIDPATQTFRCVFEIDNRERDLPAGFKVTLEEASLADICDRAAVAEPATRLATERTDH